MTTNSRRLLTSWRMTPFGGVASAVVGERLLYAWRHTSPFYVMSLADFFHANEYSRQASFPSVTLLRFFPA